MKQYTVERDGQKNLTFTGEIIADASGRHYAGREQNRWTELTLYKTQGGKFVLQREYFTQWQGEEGSDHAEVCDTPQVVYDALVGNGYNDDDNGNPELGRLDKILLKEAAEKDPAFAALLVEEVQ